MYEVTASSPLASGTNTGNRGNQQTSVSEAPQLVILTLQLMYGGTEEDIVN